MVVVADLEVPDGPALAAVRPQAVALHPSEPHGSPRNSWPVIVSDLEADRDRVRVTFTGPDSATAELTPGAVVELDLAPGVAVWATVKAVDLTAYDR